MRHLYFLLVFLFTFNNAFSQGTWTTKASLPSTGRAFASVFSIGDTAYVCAGGNLGITQTDFWAYHPATDSWVQKSTPAYQMRQGVCFVVNGKAYMCTGIPIGSMSPVAEVWEYDPVTDQWTQKNNFPGGARLSSYSFAIGNKGYLGGGSTGQAGGLIYDFWEYEPATDTWTQIPNYPIPDYFGLAGFELNGLGYLVGGFGTGSPSTVPVNRVWCYNPATSQWTQKNNFPINIGQATGFTVAGSSYILNGTLQLGSNQTKTNTLYKYDSVNDSWSLQTNFPGTARSATHVAVINNVVYAGQGLGLSSAYYDDWYQYIPAGVSALSENTMEDKFSIAPNPASEYFKVMHEGIGKSVMISDLNGRKILENNNAESTIDVSRIPNGVYIVKLNGVHQRLIVQH